MGLTKKVFKFGIFTTLLVIVLIVLGVWMMGEHAVKVGVEAGATKALGVDVTVGDIDISAFQGQLGIQDLVIANPQGYELKNLLELSEGKIKLAIKSLLSDTVRIDKFKLDGVNLVMEQKGLTNNLQEIIKNLEKPAKEKKEEPAKDDTKKKGKNLEIADLEITNVKVRVKLMPIGGQNSTVDLNLAPIKMQNLGTDKKMDTGVLASKILVAITEGIAKEGAGVLPADMVEGLSGALDAGVSAIEKGKELIESGKEKGKELIESSKEKSKEITEGLKGIFKKSDE